MARVAVQTESSKGFRGRVNRRRMTARAAITEALLVPRQFIQVDPVIDLSFWTKHCLRVQQRELPIAIFLEEAHSMAATKKIFNLSSYARQGWLLLHHGLQVRRILALPDSDAVRVFLPGRANVIAMAKQTLVAVNIFRNRLTDMIAAPRGRVACALSRLGRRRLLLTGSSCRRGNDSGRSEGRDSERKERRCENCAHLSVDGSPVANGC